MNEIADSDEREKIKSDDGNYIFCTVNHCTVNYESHSSAKRKII